MQTHFPSGTWYSAISSRNLADRITAATNGELVIETHAPGSIVSTGDKLIACSRGTLDAAFNLPGPIGWGKIPAAGHLNGNLATFSSTQEMEYFMFEMARWTLCREAYAERGVYVVGPIAGGGVTLFGKRPIRTLDDFGGYRIRNHRHLPRGVLEKAWRGTRYRGRRRNSNQALQTGVVDAAHWGSISGGMSMNFPGGDLLHFMQPDLVNPPHQS